MSQPPWVTRRELLKKTGALAAAGVAGLPILAACGGGAPAAAPTSAPAAAAPTSAAAAAAPTAAGAAAAATSAPAAGATPAAAAGAFKFAKRGDGSSTSSGGSTTPR